MKTLQELYNEVIGNDELKKEFVATITDESAAKAFLEKNGCDANLEDLKAFFKEKFAPESGAMKELEDADLDEVAGGGKGNTVATSLISFGVGCAIAAGVSASEASAGECLEKVGILQK